MCADRERKPKDSKSHKKKHELDLNLPVQKYNRGALDVKLKAPKSRIAKANFERVKEQIVDAARHTSAAEILLPTDPGGIELEDKSKKIFKLKHEEIVQNVDLNTSRNAFNFQLQEFGPYLVNYSRNGRHLLFGGRRGHVASYDCHNMEIVTELQLQQDVNDVQFLHNDTLFAVAQRQHVYIYDKNGIEIHCMKRHDRPLKLDFLPYHFLLVSTGHSGHIRWHDVSTGEYVSGQQTGHGPCSILKQNPYNAVMHCGHSNGVVTMWAPTTGKALASIFCHKSPLTDIAIDREGRYMATAGLDGFMKIWDLRKMDHLHSFRLERPGNSLDISERGVVGVGMGRKVQLLRDAFTRPYDVTYLNYELSTPNAALSSGGGITASSKALLSRVSVASVAFRPLEDVLCVGHTHGVTSFIAPGTGEPNFDSFEANPFHTIKQRREAEVQSLLNKLSPDMISLDANFIGGVDTNSQVLAQEQSEIYAPKGGKEQRDRNRKRGRNKISARLRRRQKNVVDEQMVKFREAKKVAAEKRQAAEKLDNAGTALARFARSTTA
jgi:U3 small nucleolar RNA-associated protein 7